MSYRVRAALLAPLMVACWAVSPASACDDRVVGSCKVAPVAESTEAASGSAAEPKRAERKRGTRRADFRKQRQARRADRAERRRTAAASRRTVRRAKAAQADEEPETDVAETRQPERTRTVELPRSVPMPLDVPREPPRQAEPPRPSDASAEAPPLVWNSRVDIASADLFVPFLTAPAAAAPPSTVALPAVAPEQPQAAPPPREIVTRAPAPAAPAADGFGLRTIFLALGGVLALGTVVRLAVG
jgi:hypothetical protein